jgi:riboflavin synthase
MFTGLVAERGRVLSDPAPSPKGGVLLRVGCSVELGERLSIGASLAVSGVCLTVVELTGERDACVLEMGEETLRRTTLGGLREGSAVNLEPALRMGDPLGGHWVQGHVDMTVELLARDDREDHSVLTFSLPAEVAPFVVEKGSVCLDGVSLTVASLEETGEDDRFTVWLVPHTQEVTTLGTAAPGDRLNFEADVLAKYVARQLAGREP